MLANYHEEFKIPFYQFEDFEEITTKVEITHASSRRQGYNDRDSNFSKPLSLTFEAFHHKFSRVGPEASNFGPIPWKIDLN